MSLLVYTARMGRRWPDGLPVTRKIVTHKDGLPFAPSAPLLDEFLAHRKAGREEDVWPEYVRRYTAEMRASYRDHRAAWDALLARESVTLLCFCPDPSRCHRGVLAGILGRCGAVVIGER